MSIQVFQSDARLLADCIPPKSVDLVFTSPPYWKCRDYGHPDQIGQEETPDLYLKAIYAAIDSWRQLLRPHASVFINIKDTFRGGVLAGIPARFEVAAEEHGWLVTNRAIWAKDRGVPERNSYRLVNRYEYIFQLAQKRRFFFDLYALKEHLAQPSNPGDVWNIPQMPSKSEHLAPFPTELARRVILLACPERICPQCGQPHTRRLEPDNQLNPERKQSRRAREIYEASNLTDEHLTAIRAVGISDAGKGRKTQNGANKNAVQTQKLAQEAKEVLGGYFREFTFAPKMQVGWNTCECDVAPIPGVVLDPFMGSGTTLLAARELGRSAIGGDLNPLPTGFSEE